MIPITHTKPTGHTLGGAEFIAPAGRTRASDMRLRVVVDAGATNQEPVELALCASGVRTYTELSIEEAETLAMCLASAVRFCDELLRIGQPSRRAMPTRWNPSGCRRSSRIPMVRWRLGDVSLSNDH